MMTLISWVNRAGQKRW